MNIEGFITLFAWLVGVWGMLAVVLAGVGAKIKGDDNPFRLGWCPFITFLAAWAWILSR